MHKAFATNQASFAAKEYGFKFDGHYQKQTTQLLEAR